VAVRFIVFSFRVWVWRCFVQLPLFSPLERIRKSFLHILQIIFWVRERG